MIELLQTSTPTLMAVVAMLGLLVGSFLNVVIYRLPIIMKNEWQQQCDELNNITQNPTKPFNLVTPRSSCPHCQHSITALENVPVISYIALGGQCSKCHHPISKRYPLVEIVTACLSGVVAWRFGFEWACLGGLLLTWSLIVLTFIDIDHQLLPDNITLPLLWAGISFNLFSIYTDIQTSVIGAMAGYLSLWLIFHIFKLSTGKEGMGYGDFKLLAALAAWLGWQSLPDILVLSSFIGATIGLLLIALRQHKRDDPIPFGPYLAIAGWITLIWSNEINAIYLSSWIKIT